MYKNIGAYENLGIDKLLALTKHWRLQKLGVKPNIGVHKT